MCSSLNLTASAGRCCSLIIVPGSSEGEIPNANMLSGTGRVVPCHKEKSKAGSISVTSNQNLFCVTFEVHQIVQYTVYKEKDRRKSVLGAGKCLSKHLPMCADC